jgi:hypothetical protein
MRAFRHVQTIHCGIVVVGDYVDFDVHLHPYIEAGTIVDVVTFFPSPSARVGIVSYADTRANQDLLTVEFA